MSRTYRKPSLVVEQGKVHYINDRIGRGHRYSGMLKKTVKRRKPRDQYEAEYKTAYDTAWAAYDADLARASYDDLGRPFIGYRRDYWNRGNIQASLVPNYIYEPRVYVSKYYYETIEETRAECVERYSKEYDSYVRDGKLSESGRKTGFKEASTKVTRIANKNLVRRIIKDEEFDHLAYPNHHDGDYLRWSFW
jgi:hypothetical protein